MRKTILISVALLAALVWAATPASAQRGRPMNPGAGGMGHGAAMPHGDHSTGGASAPATAHASGKNVDEILSLNAKLSSKIHSLTGMDAKTACSGFKNLGQCVAAAHVSKNLGISFTDLRTKMTGGSSLGKAIQALEPAADAHAELKKANKQAKEDLNEHDS